MSERLDADEVHIWMVRPESIQEPELLGDYERLLSPDERAKRDRFRFPKDQHSCLVTRALVRTTLSRYADVPPEAWTFRPNEYGRPRVDEPRSARGLRFNLSHTKGLIACIVGWERDVGVDVEDRHRGGRLIEVADRFFSPAEVRALRALPERDQLERFFLYWTLKESYIKARGMGLAIPLAHFSFELDHDLNRGIRIAFAPELPDEPSSWQFTSMSFGKRHAVAAAVRRAPGEAIRVRLQETVPLGGGGPGRISRR